MSEYNNQWTMWLAQKATRQQLKDKLDQPREVTHTLLFKSRSNATKAAEKLFGLGYKVSKSNKLFSSTILASHMTSLSDSHVSSMLRMMTELCAEFRGKYDGFGAEVLD